MKISVMNNDTRWRNVAEMVKYGLQNREGIEMYCGKMEADLAKDILREEDWQELQMVCEYN